MRGLSQPSALTSTVVQYQMREKVFSIGDDFWIETAAGERAFKVNGKALRLRDTLDPRVRRPARRSCRSRRRS